VTFKISCYEYFFVAHFHMETQGHIGTMAVVQSRFHGYFCYKKNGQHGTILSISFKNTGVIFAARTRSSG